MTTRTRREFLREATVGTAAAFVASHTQSLAASQATAASPWRSRIGLELYTVRDLMTDYEGTLAKVAEIGYTEVEPTTYNNLSPKDVRAMLDRLKLTMPSMHAPARGTGADLFDFKPVFAHASLAGLKHFAIEQDTAAAWGDSLAAARVSYHNLMGMLP